MIRINVFFIYRRNKKKKKSWSARSARNVKKNANVTGLLDRPARMDAVVLKAISPFPALGVSLPKVDHLEIVLVYDQGNFHLSELHFIILQPT